MKSLWFYQVVQCVHREGSAVSSRRRNDDCPRKYPDPIRRELRCLLVCERGPTISLSGQPQNLYVISYIIHVQIRKTIDQWKFHPYHQNDMLVFMVHPATNPTITMFENSCRYSVALLPTHFPKSLILVEQATMQLRSSVKHQSS